MDRDRPFCQPNSRVGQSAIKLKKTISSQHAFKDTAMRIVYKCTPTIMYNEWLEKTGNISVSIFSLCVDVIGKLSGTDVMYSINIYYTLTNNTCTPNKY